MATRSRSLRPPLASPPRSSSDSGGAPGGTAALPGSAAGRRADTTTPSGRPRPAADELADRRGDLPVLRRPPGIDVHRGCRNFSAGNAAHPGRFQPCTAGRRRTPLPVLYGAGDVDTALIDKALIDAALSETVFHDVPIRGSKHLAHAQLVHRLGVALIARRDLLLVDLTSDGLRRLGLTRGELIESDSRSYPQTPAWARALHDHWQRIDGLLWACGQRDTGRALLLFGDRVKASELALAPGAASAHPRRRRGAAGGLRRRQPRRPHPLRPHLTPARSQRRPLTTATVRGTTARTSASRKVGLHRVQQPHGGVDPRVGLPAGHRGASPMTA